MAYANRRRPPEAELTTEQLRLAMRHLQRPHWPTDLQAVLDHPVLGPCVRGLARQLQRAPVVDTRGPSHRLPRPPVPATPTEAPRRMRGPIFDHKKAAANDRDD